MKKTYKQLTADERDKIAIFMARGVNLNNIARILGRNRSTISREIRRQSKKLQMQGAGIFRNEAYLEVRRND